MNIVNTCHLHLLQCNSVKNWMHVTVTCKTISKRICVFIQDKKILGILLAKREEEELAQNRRDSAHWQWEVERSAVTSSRGAADNSRRSSNVGIVTVSVPDVIIEIVDL